jgi:preprotein translocase subunit SecF
MIKFNKFYTHFNLISLILVILSLILLTFKGLNYGIDFKGGTLIELRSSDNNINVSNLRDNLNQMDLGDVSVKKFGNDQDYLIKFENKNDSKNIIEEIRSNLDKSFGNNFDFRRVENVGPKVSAELLKSGVIAISVSLALMLIYIWIRFEWQFSLGAIIALFHDVIITLGLFSLLSLEINLSIIAAILTIVGYSMNDTVVIFDRVRENLRKYSDIKIFELTNISINETLSRTLITSITTLLALFSIFFFGGEILKGFSLAMIFGVIFGTYSSIYIANTVLVRLNVSQKTILKEEEKINKGFELQPLLTTLVEIKVY